MGLTARLDLGEFDELLLVSSCSVDTNLRFLGLIVDVDNVPVESISDFLSMSLLYDRGFEVMVARDDGFMMVVGRPVRSADLQS